MKELKKQHLEMLQLLESIEVMLQNGDSIHPNSVIRGAIQKAIGMDINLNNIKQTAVQLLVEQMNNIKGSSISMNGRVQFIEKELNNLLEQAKAMEKRQIVDSFEKGYENGAGVSDEDPIYHGGNYYNKTFKSE